MSTLTMTKRNTVTLGQPAAERILVHHLEHVLIALDAAEKLGLPVTLQTPPQAVFTLGVGYLAALEQKARRQKPNALFHYVADCADAAGYALAALRSNLHCLVFHGDAIVAHKLSQIAQEHGALLLPPAHETLDLAQSSDTLTACTDWLNCQRLAKMKDLE